MAPDVAEHPVIHGLDPDFLGGIAGFSGLESSDVLDFAGIDRRQSTARPGLAPGRWHSMRAGAVLRRVIYCAGTRALAQLEKRVLANGIAPVGQALSRLELPDKLEVASAQAAALPGNWRDSGAILDELLEHGHVIARNVAETGHSSASSTGRMSSIGWRPYKPRQGQA